MKNISILLAIGNFFICTSQRPLDPEKAKENCIIDCKKNWFCRIDQFENKCLDFCNDFCLGNEEDALKKLCQWHRDQIDAFHNRVCYPLRESDCQWVNNHVKGLKEYECHLNNRVNSTCFNSHDGHDCNPSQTCDAIRNAGGNVGQC
jgi:hypothetical protein